MPNQVNFPAQKREVMGKKVKTLRKKGLIPANIYGDIKESMSVMVEETPFLKLYNRVGDTGVVYLEIGAEKTTRPVLIDLVSINPVTGKTDHVAFKQVNLKEKITAEVPVEIIGEPGINDVVVVKIVDSVAVEALPTDLPEKFEIDISSLTEVGQSISYQDLKYDKTLVSLVIEEEKFSDPMVLIQNQAAAEVEPVVEVAVTEAGGASEASAATPDAAQAAADKTAA
jgi:large subunit ribosomal protein L25